MIFSLLTTKLLRLLVLLLKLKITFIFISLRFFLRPLLLSAIKGVGGFTKSFLTDLVFTKGIIRP